MRPFLAAAVAVVLAGACSSDSKTAVRVTATDSTCAAARKTFTAGKVTFEVKNAGKKVTELYVYKPGDEIVGEVENVGPGTSRQLTVSLEKGSYQLACKPGQTGHGIRVPITVEEA